MLNRLYVRQHTYYVRIAIPREVMYLAKKKQLCYSLHTKDYNEALRRLRKESAKADMLINYMRRLHMEIKDNVIQLTQPEIMQLLAFQMRKIDDFCDMKELQIKEENGMFKDFDYGKDTVLAFPKSLEDKTAKIPGLVNHRAPVAQKRIQEIFYEFLDWLNTRPETKVSTKELIARIKVENYPILYPHDPFSWNDKILSLYRSLLAIDKYAEDRFKQIRGEIDEVPKTTMLKNLEQAMLQQKYHDTNNSFKTTTKWQEAFKDMVRPTKFTRKAAADTIEQKQSCLETIFQLIDKEYVEQITYDDCKLVNKLIYQVPKKWKDKFPNKRVLDVLLPETSTELHPDAMSARSIYKYLTIFQEFLKYCRKSKMIDEDLADLIDKPYVDKKGSTYKPFTQEDLLLIFNPKTYFKQTKDKDDPKFWIPLMSLFSGARLNELAQIRLDDIKVEKDIYYIQTAGSESHPQQSLKNPQSRRRIPIHPKLKELGFLNLVQHQRKKKAEFLFSSLNYQKKNGFGGAISNAFRHYLDHTIKLTDKKKVFHSFRHTVRPKLRDECRLDREYIDALCGWEETGGNAGTRTYAHKENMPIKDLYEAISRLQYPYLEPYFLEMQKDKKQRAPQRKG